MGKQPIEPYVRVQPVVLYQSGLNLSKISKQLHVSRCFVRSAVIKFEEYAKFDDMKRFGPPKSLSNRNVRELKRLVQGDNRLSAAKIATKLNMSLSKLMCKAYSGSIFEEAWLRVCRQDKNQWLSAKHRKARVTVV